MKYCIYCGKEIADDAVYCTSCGKKQVLPKKEIPKDEGGDGLGFGIASLCLCWFPILAIIFGIIGLIKGVKANRVATVVCASIGLILGVIFSVIYLIAFFVNLPVLFPHNYNCQMDPYGGWVCRS